jgi:hypothetical protein
MELLYNGVGLDVLGIGYEGLDPKLRDKVVAQFPRVDFHRQIAQAFGGGRRAGGRKLRPRWF